LVSALHTMSQCLTMAQVAALDQNTPADNQSVTIHSAADVSRLVNAGSDHRSHARIIIAIALGGVFLDAYDLGAMAFGVKDIAREFALTPAGIGMVTSAITFGAIVGAFFGGYLTDKIGRYRVFMADMFFFVIAALACAIAPNAWILGGARFVMGLGVGIDLPVAMAFLAEFSRLKGRGNKASSIAMWCPTWYAAISISYMLVLALYTALPAEQTHWLWRLILGFGAVPALAIIIIRSRYISESPVWAANQGDLAGAARILRHSYGINARIAPSAQQQPAPLPLVARWSNYRRLLQGIYLRRTVLATIIAIASSFAYNYQQFSGAIHDDHHSGFAGAESAFRVYGRADCRALGAYVRRLAHDGAGLSLSGGGAGRTGAHRPPGGRPARRVGDCHAGVVPVRSGFWTGVT